MSRRLIFASILVPYCENIGNYNPVFLIWFKSSINSFMSRGIAIGCMVFLTRKVLQTTISYSALDLRLSSNEKP